MTHPTSPLDGIRVIELATMVMVPSAGCALADFGADVIKVEPLHGDLNRRGHLIPGMPDSDLEYCYLQDNRNKRSLAIDLKRAEARDILLALVRRCDVLLTNHRAAALRRLGLDWESLREVNPRLIYAHGTGYGDCGDEAGQPGFDAVCYWSRSALEATLFPIDGWLGAVPYGSGDHPSGMTLFGAVMLALFRRERSGVGGRVSTSLLANGAWSNATTIQARLVEAEFHERLPRENPRNFAAVYYRCADGHAFKFAIVDHEATWPRFCRAAGRADLVEDPRFATNRDRAGRMGELVEIFDEAFSRHPISHWKRAFADHDVPFSALSNYDDVVSDSQMEANGVFVEMEHPERGSLRSIANPIRVDDSAQTEPRLAPALGGDTTEVLTELGLADDRISQLLASRVVVQAPRS